MTPYTLSTLVTLGTSLLIFSLAYRVGAARMKHKTEAYAQTQEKEILVANRVHMNTVEMTVVYVPILWIATVFASANIAGVLGLLWLLSRIGYALSYSKDPKKRQIPFMLGMVCIVLTTLLALYGIIF